jgi:hypothetical protein
MKMLNHHYLYTILLVPFSSLSLSTGSNTCMKTLPQKKHKILGLFVKLKLMVKHAIRGGGGRIQEAKIGEALKRMKGGKAMGPDGIPIEVWRCLGKRAVVWLTKLFNLIFRSNKMPEEWRRSILVPIFKNKGDVQSCTNYLGIKLMSHTMKLWERVIEHRLRRLTR